MLCCAVLCCTVLCCAVLPLLSQPTLRNATLQRCFYMHGLDCYLCCQPSYTEIRIKRQLGLKSRRWHKMQVAFQERCHGSSLDCKAGGETRGELAPSPSSLPVPRSASPLLHKVGGTSPRPTLLVVFRVLHTPPDPIGKAGGGEQFFNERGAGRSLPASSLPLPRTKSQPGQDGGLAGVCRPGGRASGVTGLPACLPAARGGGGVGWDVCNDAEQCCTDPYVCMPHTGDRQV